MKFSSFNISVLPLSVILLSVIYGSLQAVAFGRLVVLPFDLLLLTGFVDGILFAGIGMLLMRISKYSYYTMLDFYQRLINYMALGFLSVAVWAGSSYLFSYLVFSQSDILAVNAMVPMKVFTGILVYLLIMQFIQAHKKSMDGKMPEDDPEDVLPGDVTDSENGSDAMEILERIIIKTGQKLHVILVPDIVYIQSDGDYVQIYTEQNKYIKEETMKFFETHLPHPLFVRVHRSYIVNVEKILRIELYGKENQMLTLKNGDRIKTSATGYKALRKALSL